jgi:hypothetical protein
LKKGPEGEPRALLQFLAMGTGYFLLVVRFRTVRRVRLAAGVAFFAALRRRRFVAGAFLALDFFVALRRFFAGARFFAALRFLAGAFFAARFFVARFLVAFLAVVFRFAVDFRFAGAFRFAALRLPGAFLAARRFVAFFAGGTVTTFLGELSLGEVRTSSHSVRGGATHALRHQELFTSFFSSDPTVNFTLFDAAIWIGSRVCGFIPVRALRCEMANVPKRGSVTLSPLATAPLTALMNAFNAFSASVLLKFASLAIASTSSPLFTAITSTRCVRSCNENVFTRERQAFPTQCA